MTTRGTLMMFWDYDTQWGGDRSRGAGGPKLWGDLDFENTERLLELHATYHVPACFAVVGAAALPGERPYHDPRQIRAIAHAGHEVASHAMRHEWLPGLDRAELIETLRTSKDSLEQCTGMRVLSFVPPYNQPFDYPAGGAFSLSERRLAPRHRTGLQDLCEALQETEYRFCRVAYRPAVLQLAEAVIRRRIRQRNLVRTIGGIRVLRLDASGFDAEARALLERCAARQDFLVVYGHPHSLHSGNAQDESFLIPFLKTASELIRTQRIVTCLPRDLAHDD